MARVWWSYHVHVGEGVERGCSEGVGCAGGPVLRGSPQHGEYRETERRGASTSAATLPGQEGAGRSAHWRTPAVAASGTTGVVTESEAEPGACSAVLQGDFLV